MKRQDCDNVPPKKKKKDARIDATEIPGEVREESARNQLYFCHVNSRIYSKKLNTYKHNRAVGERTSRTGLAVKVNSDSLFYLLKLYSLYITLDDKQNHYVLKGEITTYYLLKFHCSKFWSWVQITTVMEDAVTFF